MCRSNLLPIVLVFMLAPACGQHLSRTTNHIYINNNSAPVNTASIPVIHWLKPSVEHTMSQENRIVIEAEINCLISLKEVELVLSDPTKGEIYSRKKFDVPPDTRRYNISQVLHLPNGSVKIELLTGNADGAQVRSDRSIIVGEDIIANAVLIDRKDYALIFATDKYDNWDDLLNPVNDAHSVASELKTRYGFETEVIENPTMEEVWEKIHAYSERKFKAQDQLLIFFAGHGHFDETFNEGYVVAKNSLANDKSKASYVSHNRLRGVLNNISCQHIFLLMDVCFGGTFDPVIAKSRGSADTESNNEQFIVRKLSHKTRKYLTSGGKEYVSDGLPGAHSPFATKLIEALKSNGGNDRILTIAELQANLEKLKQLPRFGSFGEDEQLSDFIFIAK